MTLYLRISLLFFFFKQKTAYERRISDWSSDVCSSDLRYVCSFSPSRNRERKRDVASRTKRESRSRIRFLYNRFTAFYRVRDHVRRSIRPVRHAHFAGLPLWRDYCHG